MEVYVTFESADGHQHIIVVNSEGDSYCTPGPDGHEHGVEFVPPKEVMIDRATGEKIQSAADGYYILGDTEHHPAEIMSGEELTQDIKDPYKRMDDKQKAELVESYLANAAERESESRTRGNEAIRMIDRNIQWEEDDKPEEGRAAITTNRMAPVIEMIEGEFQNNITDIRCNPNQKGSQIGADSSTYLLKHISELSKFPSEEMDIFHDEAVPGRGIFEGHPDWNSNPEGEVIIGRFPWDHIYFGEHLKKDGRDRLYEVHSGMYSFDQMVAMYPNKEQEFYKTMQGGMTAPSGTAVTTDDGIMITATTAKGQSVSKDEVAKTSLTIPVYELWIKVPMPSYVLVDTNTQEAINIDNWKQKYMTMVKKLNEIMIMPRSTFRMKILRVAGSAVLEDYWLRDRFPRLKEDIFFTTPAYCLRIVDSDGELFLGKGELIKDEQKLINKLDSLMLDYANYSLGQCKFYDDDTFPTDEDKDDYLENGQIPWHVQRITDVTRKPGQDENRTQPVIHILAEIIQNREITMEKILNLNPEFRGQTSSSNQSGIAILRQQARALLGLVRMMKNYSYSKLSFFKNMLKLAQQVYSPEQILEMIVYQGSKSKGKVPTLDGMEVVGKREQRDIGQKPTITHDEIIDFLYDEDYTEVDMVMSEEAYSPTVRLAYFTIILEVMKVRPDVPAEMFIMYSPFPQEIKDEMLGLIRQQREFEQNQEQAKMNVELQKTQIANQPSSKDYGKQKTG